MNQERPAVTLLVMSFNHEKYVSEALAGALSQDYSPLEIICSDDASSDATYRIMRDVCAAYGGPHKVAVRRNGANIGLAAHLNLLMGIASGDLIVIAAADDISLPDRCRVLADEWVQNGRPIGSIYSAFEAIDERGRPLGTGGSATKGDLMAALGAPNQGVTGATHAWSSELFRLFGALAPDLVYEDRALQFRSMLAGGVLYVDRPLVKYRLTRSSLSRHQPATYRDAMIKAAQNHERRACVYRTFLQDLGAARAMSLVEDVEADLLKQEAERQVALAEVKARFLRADSWTRIGIICTHAKRVPVDQLLRWTVILFAPWSFSPRLFRKPSA